MPNGSERFIGTPSWWLTSLTKISPFCVSAPSNGMLPSTSPPLAARMAMSVRLDESITASTLRRALFAGLSSSLTSSVSLTLPGRSSTRLSWPCQIFMLLGITPLPPLGGCVPKFEICARSP